jgi:2,4'-dihydroxyacetophenone dioxygenase
MNDLAELSAVAAGGARLPWIPVAPGITSKSLAFLRDGNGWVSLLRLDPGAEIPPHRHRGEVHGFVLSGRRRLGPTGPVLGPGAYEYEPAGQVDTWMVEGTEPLTGLFIVRGAVEYLDAEGNVVREETTESKAETYRRFCAERGLRPLDLHR